MKTTSTLAALAGIAFFTSLALNPSFDRVIKRLGDKQFYVYIVDAGKRTLAGINRPGYQYRVPAMNSAGEEKTLSFTSDKQLSLDTYVRLYVSPAGKVMDWEELPSQEVSDLNKHGQLP